MTSPSCFLFLIISIRPLRCQRREEIAKNALAPGIVSFFAGEHFSDLFLTPVFVEIVSALNIGNRFAIAIFRPLDLSLPQLSTAYSQFLWAGSFL